jgi:hypothetical protein
MIDMKLMQDSRLVFLFVWLILMLYGVYRFYKKTNFREISLWNFMLASCLFFWCGYITTAMIFGIEHLHLLPFMPFGILTLARWCELNLIGVIAGCLIPPTLLFMIYRLLIKCVKKYLIFYAALMILLWLGLFCGGGVSFLYVLSRFIF